MQRALQNWKRAPHLVCWLLLAAACEDKPAQPAEQRTEPWPAPAVSAHTTERRTQRKYVLAPQQKLSFALQTKSTTISGEFRWLEGSLSVDLMNLQHSDGKLKIDLPSVRIAAEAEGQDKQARDYSMMAQNWLNIGASLPEAVRTRRRWASFLIEQVEETQASAAHEARLDRKLTRQVQQPEVLDAGADVAEADASAEDSDEPELRIEEVRVSRVQLLGSLTLNQRRVTQSHNVNLQFHYTTQATPGMPPARIVVTTPRPIAIPLSQHHIEPRDSEGRQLSKDLKLLGEQVGRTARVSFELSFVDPEQAKSAGP